MCDRNKVQQILRYVWLLTSISLNENISSIAESICKELAGYGEIDDITDLLDEISIKKYDGNISSEKSLEVAKLIMS